MGVEKKKGVFSVLVEVHADGIHPFQMALVKKKGHGKYTPSYYRCLATSSHN